jgi:C4-type Zn-finger protein
MPATKDCPLCGGTMRLKETQSVTQVPGNPKPITRVVREWACPDCDYFEEAEDEDDKA